MLKALKITAIALGMSVAFTGTASAQIEGIDPAQAKTVSDQMINCAAIYGAGADMFAQKGDAESQKRANDGRSLAASSTIAAMTLNIVAGLDGAETIQSQIDGKKPYYTGLISSGNSTELQSQLSICTSEDMVGLTNSLVDIAKQAMNAQ